MFRFVAYSRMRAAEAQSVMSSIRREEEKEKKAGKGNLASSVFGLSFQITACMSWLFSSERHPKRLVLNLANHMGPLSKLGRGSYRHNLGIFLSVN